jgi:sucrose-phosphate synthase
VRIGLLNPQGNFDPDDSHLATHPDFGGQLVYVKQLALALGRMGHRVDVITRRVEDPAWPEFAEPLDGYPGNPNVRIVRIDAGDDAGFLPKEELWPWLVRDWVPGISAFYGPAGLPDAFAAHYGDGGLAGVLLEERHGTPFTFTAHSLGAQKLDKLAAVGGGSLADLDATYRFGTRLNAERLAMNRSKVNVTSTVQERREQYGHPAYAGAVEPDDEDEFAVVPPGVDLETFGRHASGPDAEVAAWLDAELDRHLAGGRRHLPVVVASSRLDPKKNVTGLVAAYAGDRELQEVANLVLFTGALPDPLADPAAITGPEAAVIGEIAAIVAAAGIADRVAAFGLMGQQRLAAAYRALARQRSVFALTALYEPFGLAPLEAAAAGLPVVVTENGGPAESLRDSSFEYGVLVDPADPAAIAAGLRRALGPEWDDFSRAGERRVLDRYTWDRTAAGYLAALQRPELGAPVRHRLPIPEFLLDPEVPATVADLEGVYSG